MGSLSHSVLYLHGVLPQHSPSSDFGENQLSRGLISLSLLLSSHLRIFQHSRVRSSTWCYPASTCSRVDHLRFGSIARDLVALLALGFPSPPPQSGLGWPRTITRRLIMQKASSHHVHSKADVGQVGYHPASQTGMPAPEWTWLLHIVGIWFQVLFHSPNRGSFHLSLAVLVHYRLPRSI